VTRVLLIETIIHFVDRIKQNVKPIAEDDFQKLQSFARKNGETEPLEAFDIPFWQTKHTNEFYK
jgi:Zn-dependent oligopeptidase